MCFAKKAPAPPPPKEEIIVHEADASLTKNSDKKNNFSAYKDNLKTTPVGLQDNAKTDKKTLLGE